MFEAILGFVLSLSALAKKKHTVQHYSFVCTGMVTKFSLTPVTSCTLEPFLKSLKFAWLYCFYIIYVQYLQVQLIQKNHVQIGGIILGMSMHQYSLIKYPTPQ